MRIDPIAYIHTPMREKFGIPRQSGLAADLPGYIVFCEEYRNAQALDGLDGYDYIWLLWEFEPSKNADKGFRAKVRPPRLGGNEYVGVFATRSPFRPNPIGLSSVKIDRIEMDTAEGPIIHVLGADLRDGTPIFDIKPYLPYVDAHPKARGGFTDATRLKELEVEFEEGYISSEINENDRLDFEQNKKPVLIQLLSQDPRPAYQDNPDREYGLAFYEYEVKFTVNGDKVTVKRLLK